MIISNNTTLSSPHSEDFSKVEASQIAEWVWGETVTQVTTKGELVVQLQLCYRENKDSPNS